MVISKQFIQEIDGLVGNKSLVLGIDKAVPILLRESTQDIIILGIKFNLVLVKVIKQIFCTKNLCNLDQLIRVAVPVEERLLSEYHRSKHGT